MEFQNPILNFERTDRRMEGGTSPKQYAPSTFANWEQENKCIFLVRAYYLS